jgi:hypothetical protein
MMNDKTVDDREAYEAKVKQIMGMEMPHKVYLRTGLSYIKTFISTCSLSDFEKLKEMDYDLATDKTNTDDTAE